MDSFLKKLLLCAALVVLSMVAPSSAQTCSSYTFSNNKLFSSCTDLPYLSSFLHWTYDSAAGTAQIAYRHASVDTSKWVAWAINPTGSGMVGAQSLVAYQQSNGTMLAYTSPIAAYQTQLQEGSLSFNVSDLSATSTGSEIIIFATIVPPNNGAVNQVWQDGPLSGGSPSVHATTGANVQSMGTLNFASGQAGSSGGSNSKIRKRNTHGVLNAVSWGILLPIGAIIARYLKVSKAADPAWFYLHIACQTSAYIVGVAGWATGIKLGSDSPGITYSAHRTIGIVLFCLGTVQVFALLLRPKKDHKFRFYWNVYHHSIGYAVIILSIINIFKGFDILNPDKKWKHAYIGVIAALGCVAVALEGFTWYVVLKRRRSQGGSKVPHGMNGSNGYNHNGYGARPHQEA